jgi:putative hydrolase of the HAD superfamily
MARIRAVVFDVGGTLLYPVDPVGETYAKVARKHGLKLNADAANTAFREAFASCSPRAKGTVPSNGDDRAWWKQVVTKSLGEQSFADTATFDVFFEELYAFFAKPDAWGIYPEVHEVLEAMRDHDVELAVLSNWDARLNGILDGLGLGEVFRHRFISAELGWEKPDPSIYRHVAEILRLQPGSLLSVGDHPKNDIEGPKKAGWQAVQIERPKRDLWAAVRAMTKR